MSSKPLADRVAIVTGAGRNIGRDTALMLAEDGAAVVVNARSNQAEADAVVRAIEQAGGKAMTALADIADGGAVDRMVAATVERFGRVDMLINNAALRREKSLDEMTITEWRDVMAVTLDGPFLCVKACLPHLERSGAGVIINVGGLSGHSGARDRLHVITAKSGLVGFTRGLAQDLADHKITVNLVVPGLVGTHRPGPEPQHHSTHHTLTGDRVPPAEVAATIRFLCGPLARHITGQTIHVNGGAYLG
ncbi:MAG TPA: SDR family oxidoreductase [Xanthobacteraceae bacterium]|nr:SDR family oxidoreductase [Xanthobacteraceae bacterium]